MTKPRGTPGDDDARGITARGQSARTRTARGDAGRLTHDPRVLWKERPKSGLVRLTIVAIVIVVAYSWFSGDIAFDDLYTARRITNLQRFVTVDVQPFELRDHPFSLTEHIAWAWKLFREHGFEGAVATLAIAVLAITLAGACASILMLFAAENIATAWPFEPARPGALRHFAWRALASLVRAFLIFLRAIPEYIWAYLLLAMLGASAWPAVLALAIHNSGILGKLGAETVENLEPKSLRALRLLGASRAQIAVSAIFPMSLSRCLLYFFYRFETCVREATVLGMLGVVSLGYWIQDARSRQFYDQMVFFVALGATIVLAADLVSALVRRRIRRTY